MSQHDGKLCVNCCFWGEQQWERLNMCRRNPPHKDGWPLTQENDWCGQWQPEAPNRRAEREAGTLKDLA